MRRMSRPRPDHHQEGMVKGSKLRMVSLRKVSMGAMVSSKEDMDNLHQAKVGMDSNREDMGSLRMDSKVGMDSLHKDSKVDMASNREGTGDHLQGHLVRVDTPPNKAEEAMVGHHRHDTGEKWDDDVRDWLIVCLAPEACSQSELPSAHI
jgi:hypothetical protein